MSKKKKVIIAIAAIVLVLGIIIAFSLSGGNKKPEIIEEKEEVEEEKIEEPAKKEGPVSLTTGEVLDSEPVNTFSVMIENSPSARPQSGLSSADIVYEMMTEGDITRYLAFYHNTIPSTIGPVRSSRHYFIPVSEERNFPYIHFGASTYAYDYLENRVSVPTIDGIKSESTYFMRDSLRVAPHNAYLLSETLPVFENTPLGEPFFFEDSAYEDYNSVSSISFSYNGFTQINYEYQVESNKYLRFLQGSADTDMANGKQVSPSNIVLQYAKHDDLNDKKNRIDIEMTGSGKAIFYTGGKKIEGTWSKNDNEVTKYLDDMGNVIKLSPGKTWIQVVSSSIDIVEN